MKQNRQNRHHRHTPGFAQRLRHMEDRLDTFAIEIQRMNTRMIRIQSEINARNDMELDQAIDRMRHAAQVMKESAEKERQAIMELCTAAGEGKGL